MAERLENCLREGPGEIEMAVKTRPFHARTKRPRGALLQLDPVLNFRMCSVRGSLWATMKHLSFWSLVLTDSRYPASRQGLAGSLTGAVPTKRVTVGSKGQLI